MEITNLIADHIKEVYEGNNWTGVDIASTISDISLEEAQQRTEASANSIASLLHHLHYWNGILMQRLKGSNPSVPEHNGFNVAVLNNESEWKELIDKTHRSFVELADAANDFDEEKLFEISPTGASSYYKNLHGVVEHAHYHLGQMVIIKKLIRSKR